MTKEEIIDLCIHYDERVDAGMSIAEQLEFLTANYKVLNETCNVYRDPIHHNTINSFVPLDFLMQTSSHLWDLFDPTALKSIPYAQQVLLALIGEHHDMAPFVFSRIISATSLPLETRALFCAARMSGWAWTEQTRFFGNYYRRLCLRKQLLGESEPNYPTTFSPRRFYHGLNSSYASQIPPELAAAISADNNAQFSIALTLCNRQLSKNLLLHLIRQSATNILVANLGAIDKFLSFEKTILFCVSSVPTPTTTALLSAIEKAAPGSISKASDIFGNNGLWYLFYRDNHCEIRNDHPQSIETLLLDCGCDPHHLNCIGLDYASTAKARRQLLLQDQR